MFLSAVLEEVDQTALTLCPTLQESLHRWLNCCIFLLLTRPLSLLVPPKSLNTHEDAGCFAPALNYRILRGIHRTAQKSAQKSFCIKAGR